MSLRNRIIAAVRSLMLQAVLRHEESRARGSLASALSLMDYQLDHLMSLASDWAVWDETYDFMTTLDPVYTKQNLSVGTFSNLKLSLMAFVNEAVISSTIANMT
ncbi:MAG: PAS/PAC sensor-containing diguanylate cyclase [Bacillota bacterium]|nr:MAG: PAS/PAC sensor-containing diguanylate cyclase [Bacillota bacterium]